MKLRPVPRGMSPGFYAFMGAGGVRGDSGQLMMLDTMEGSMRYDNYGERMIEPTPERNDDPPDPEPKDAVDHLRMELEYEGVIVTCERIEEWAREHAKKLNSGPKHPSIEPFTWDSVIIGALSDGECFEAAKRMLGTPVT